MKGFSILEMTVAMTIMLAATAGIFAVLLPSQGSMAAQTEASDMQQRLRVATDALSRDLVGAGALTSSVAAIRPYRAGAVRPDAPDAFKTDTITIVTMPRAGAMQSATYWQQSDDGAGTCQLLFYDGTAAGADVPVVDHLVSLQFEYWGDPRPPIRTEPLSDDTCLFAAGDPPTPKLAFLYGGPALVRLGAAQLTDGPWCPDAAAEDRWDADLLRIRRVSVTVRVEAAAASLRGPASALFVHGGSSRGGGAWLPDIEARFDVAPRNLNLAR